MTNMRTLFLVSLFFILLLLARHPDSVLHAEFWGEDGWIWYPEAYNFGWRCVLHPWSGYLQTFPRLIALAAQPFPLSWAPTIFASVAAIAQALPACFIISSRLNKAWPHLPSRILFALICILLPNSFEVYVNLTNSQWHLAILAFLVLVSAPARHWTGKAFDTAALLVSGISGPFCILLLPVAIWNLIEERSRTHYWRCGLVLAATMLQALALLSTLDGSRTTAPLGAGLGVLAQILSLQIFIGGLVGMNMLAELRSSTLWTGTPFPYVTAVAGGIIGLIAFIRGPSIFRKASVAAALLLAAALRHPQVTLSDPQWIAMTHPGSGDRYYVIPILVWIGALLIMLKQRSIILRGAGAAALAVLLLAGIPRDWPYPHFSPTDFVEKARAFQDAPPGTRMEFPIHPSGMSGMFLTKRG